MLQRIAGQPIEMSQSLPSCRKQIICAGDYGTSYEEGLQWALDVKKSPANLLT
jgi:hypothetical protein